MDKKDRHKKSIEANMYDKNYIMPRDISEDLDIYSDDSVSIGNDASPDPPTVVIKQVENNENKEIKENNKLNDENEEVIVHAGIFNLNASELSNDSSILSGEKKKIEQINGPFLKNVILNPQDNMNQSLPQSVNIELSHKDHVEDEVREQDISIKFKQHNEKANGEKKLTEEEMLNPDSEINHLLLNIDSELLRNEDDFIGNVDLDNEEMIRNVIDFLILA
jgi:hypothetical protein